ncbi:MAG: hypothetical protein IRZ30_13160 [Sphaerobacter sp.]|nr:hypothetical protein [Sphaerobacter sp.]
MVLAWANGGRGVPSRLPHREEQGGDNIVVTALLFRYFAVPAALQRRVLFWGVVGAIVMRGLYRGWRGIVRALPLGDLRVRRPGGRDRVPDGAPA